MTKQKFNKDNSSFSVTIEGKYPTHSVVGTSASFYVYIASKRADSWSKWIKGDSSVYHKLQELHKGRNLMGFVEALEEIWERNIKQN